jgi:tetratricopeptide (TPR) repeat protein
MPGAIATKNFSPLRSARPSRHEGIVQIIAEHSLGTLRRNKPFFHLYRGIIYYHLAQHDKAMQNFSMALRLNWRDESVVAWIGRTERAQRKAMRQPRPCSGGAGIPLPAKAWDRPSRRCPAGAGVEQSLLVPSLSHIQIYGLQTRVI